jgi:isoquinoline 1-oxidoreductase beta subunit
MDETPPIEVHLVKSTEEPGGLGETGCAAAFPALANAVYAATGKRLRRLPLNLPREAAATSS